MPAAVGVIQTLGFPPVLAAADAMVKAGNVTLVQYGLAESAQFFVAIRGAVSEVNPAMAAGLAAIEEVYGAQLINHYIVQNPPENIVAILPISYTEESEAFRVLPGL
ncbi:carbon dioxide-concentrating mechanism protein CcmK [Prochlorothrix hollandica]|uniref:Carboxysome shell protein CcmK n=1 Tax=Prochlorothrix hollandica PCC 9006 = CALU 1027 TaxID=317619 RepID=A0A0M2Q0G5_PROHO|nr:carbon dioxide-concentrating mechanism protein CcmK [Prochlorothrix hollandica]KKJ00434.1 cytochrome C biogenesis protein CcmK [Prochlorothrix hollandica PCC 9006 = CALU 1027]